MTSYSERLYKPDFTVSSLVELLQQRAESAPERLAYRFLGDGETAESRITYGELNLRARSIAAHLQETGARAERALLLYPAGLAYVEAFFGCLYAGVIAVPAPLPRLNRSAQRLQVMATDAGATFALTNAALLTKMESIPELARLRWLATDTIVASHAGTYSEPELSAESLAYLQYTSGSTSTPKGVMVTHGNVLHNSASIHRGFAHTPDSRALTWLPHFHDMGLIDGIIQPLYGGFPTTIMSPTSFLQHPLRWLEAITRFQITHTGGPNFAYDLCVRRVNTEQRARLDLRSWRVAYNGAEPVRFETLRRFADAFRECGFRWEAFYPAYGLAEATLKVSGAESPVTCTVRADALEQHRVVEAVPEQDDTRTLVSCGQAGLDTEIEIVDPETFKRCAIEEVGEVWVYGPGVAAGYWGRPEETDQTFRARLADADVSDKTYLRTGDLGFVRDGELFVTGRVKDLIIIRGRNLYPHDLELAVEQCHEALRAGGGAAFSVEVEGEEHLVVVQELEPRRHADTGALVELIRQTLAEEFEVQPYAILLVKAGSVPKTSSGKVQRGACRAMFETGLFDVLAEWRAPLDVGTDSSGQVETAELSSEEVIARWIRGQLAARLRIDAASIDVDSSITRYGVDSLMAIELTHSIETQLGVLLPMSEFISSQSITQIAARCFELVQSESGTAGSTDPIQVHTFPLSHGQQALWFLQQLAPESVAYNIASALRIKTKPDETALRSAFQSLVERHAALRTTFSAVQGKPMQHVHEEATASFEIIDASSWNDAALAERLRDEAHLPFDLEHGPLLRALLFKRADEEQVLLLVAHHIVIDFWSLAILMRELGELYRDNQTATSHTSNYFDYVRWEQRLLAGEAGERLATFWQKELAGELPALNLHTDRPRPAVQTFRGASEPLRLDAQLTARLKALSQANDATLFVTLLTAFKVLLYRYTGQEDLLVGSPAAGRHSAQFAETVGYFVNPVVLRTSPKGALSFEEFLKQVRHITLNALAHQEYPFALLVKQLQPERDPGRSPLFQAMFTLNKAQLAGEEGLGAFSLEEAGVRMNLGGLPLESMRLEQRIAQFDLSMTMVEIGDELSASLEYNTDLFDTATIKRMLGHFRTLLESVAARPSQTLDRLPLLYESERALLLDEWSGVARDTAPAPLVHRLFEQHVKRRPESTAVVFEGARLSYGELNARANKLAHYLRRRGVGMDVPVGICVERSLEMIVAVLGVLKAGGAYVPLDPRYPRERLAFMLADTRAPWLLTQKRLVEGLPESSAQTICLDEDWDEIAGESENNPHVVHQPDSLAYVIYTSGSTGRPKGVMVSQRSLAAAYQSWRKPYLLDSSSCVLQVASFSFDVFTADVLRGLMSGGRLVLCAQDTLLSPPDLYELMRSEKVELAEFVPALLRPFMQYLEESGQTLDFMRVVISGADALYADEYKKLRRLCADDARVFNSYGLTEATIDNIIFESSTADVNLNGTAPLGRPFAGIRVYLLDNQLQPVPVGVAGELYISGDCLARGYLNRPDLTAARFLPNPFAGEPGTRLYQTGDLARFLANGNIEFVGRKDEQVKVRGFRIELGEIEATLKQHARVRDAIVVAGTNGNGARGEKRLIAYVVVEGEYKQGSGALSHSPPRWSAVTCHRFGQSADKSAHSEEAHNSNCTSTAKQLREFLAESLSDYMIPSAFVFLDAIPVTPNGKVDRRALPAPDFSVSDTAKTDDVPRTEAERILVRIWSELLKLERVGLHDNFFHLGGDSILSIQVVARARQLGLVLTPRQIFEHPTIASLASVGKAISQTIDEQGRVTGHVSLTSIQRWFFEQNFPAPAHWNMSLLLEANERLDRSLIENTVAHLLEHHDALRLRFAREDNDWRQSIAGGEEALRCVRSVDLSGLTGTAQRSALEAAVAKAQRELDLGNGPMMQVVLFDLGSGGQRLLWVVHHLVIDGVSWRILLEDFESIYRQLQSGERVRLPSKTTSFQRWAERLEHLAQTPEVRKELDYWKAASQCTNRLPANSEGANTEGSARTFAVSLSLAETNALLQHVPEVYHTRIDDVLLTALARAFQRWTHEDALLVELEKHGREELFEDVDLSRTVGWFTSAFPVVLKLPEMDATTLGTALKSTKEQLRRIPRGGIGYGLLRYLCCDEEVVRQMMALPRAEVSFNYLGQLDQMFQSSGLFRLARESAGGTRDREAQRGNRLEINASITGGHLQAEWTYSAEIHDSATIEKLAHDFLEALQELIAHCLSTKAGAHTPSDFSLARLSQSQLDELLATRGDVTDLFHLSPMQQGMLFHILYAPTTDVYLGQFSCALQGDLDAGALDIAWQQALNRHEVLRASFVWENLDEPLQLIHENVCVPLEQYDWQHDWRGLTEDEKSERWEAFLIRERQRGFDLSTPPLMRLALVRLGSDSYRFVWTHHHLLLDGWSGALVLREVFNTYEALRRGEQVRAEPRRPFRDYITWLDRQDLSKAEAFWRENLKGFEAPTPLVIDHASVETGGSMEAAGESKAQLSEETTSRLQSLARQHGLTLNTILAGAWALLLNRYSQEETVVFGATVAGRPPSLAGIETIVGLLINTLPVRVRIDEDAEVLAWLKVLQAEQVELREYEYSPLVEVQSWSEVERGRPLFESLLVFENYPLDAAALKENLSLHLDDVRSFDRTNYPLTLVAIPEEALILQALYDRQRFTSDSIERLLGHLRTLLESIAARHSQTLAELQLLTPREREQVLVEWNQTTRDYSTDLCLHEMFEAQVERTPERIAAVHVDEELTYRELNARANKLARYLQKLGVGPETRVGILMERSLEMLMGMLAVLKAGGAYVPLDPEYPQERLGFMLADSGARVLLTQQRLAKLLPAHEARPIYLDSERQAINAESAENLRSRVNARNLAYVIYTSGSTGRPKGAAIEHRSVAIFSQWARESFAPEAFAGTLALSSICSDLSIFELFVPLHSGGKVIIVHSVLHLSQVPDAHQVTLINTVPSAINELLQLNYLPPSAYIINLAGEALPQRLVQQLYERKNIKQVFNLYGPTEDTTYSTWDLMKRDACESPTVGRPISNTQIYVLDRRGRPLPAGIPGEVYLGGMGLARGYLGRPDLTAEKFIPDPFSVEPDARMYYTGDLARYLPDGRLDFLGRIDHQVKIRGYRIELGEVEAVLNEHPAVKTCVVVAREEADNDKRLVAYIVAREGVGHHELQSFLRARLLEHMVPSAFVLLDEMPLTPNGKINRRALPAPEVLRPEIEQQYVAPRNDIEVALVELWQEVLGINPIGVSDNFFDLGGHSLKATRLLAKVRSVFRMQLPLSVVFEATTIEALACALVQHEPKSGQTAKIARVLRRIKSISSADLKDELERKRKEKSSA